MTRSTRHHGMTLRRALLGSLLIIPALLVGCSKNSGSGGGSKGPGFGAAITGTTSDGLHTATISFNPSFITPGGSTGITLYLTTLTGVAIEGQNVQWSTTAGTLNKVAGRTDAAGKDVNGITIQENFEGTEVTVTAVVAGLSVQGKLLTAVPGELRIDPPGELFLAPGDTQFLNCVGGVDPVRWEPSGGTLNRLNERSVIFTAGSLTGTFFVKCTDAADRSASVKITIGTAQTLLTITPTSATLRPGFTQIFTAQNGRPPYTWSFPSSAGSLTPGILATRAPAPRGTPGARATATGSSVTLTAGTTVGTFPLLLTDSVGATKSADVTIVVEPLVISPAEVIFGAKGSPAGPTGTCTFSSRTAQFTVTGGVPFTSGSPYKFSNAFASLGSISQTGLYTSTTFTIGTGEAGDAVTVVDSIGQQKSATVRYNCNQSTAPTP